MVKVALRSLQRPRHIFFVGQRATQAAQKLALEMGGIVVLYAHRAERLWRRDFTGPIVEGTDEFTTKAEVFARALDTRGVPADQRIDPNTVVVLDGWWGEREIRLCQIARRYDNLRTIISAPSYRDFGRVQVAITSVLSDENLRAIYENLAAHMKATAGGETLAVPPKLFRALLSRVTESGDALVVREEEGLLRFGRAYDD